MNRIKLWDLPTRLFHWLLVALIAAAFVTESLGKMELHGRVGLAILGLVVFRLCWGFMGSTYARFTQFVRGPSAVLAYLRGEWQGLGHNPLGALSVLAILGTVTLQVATGLFANDDSSFFGPLAALVSSDLSSQITEIHEAMEPVLLTLIAAHLGAIMFYGHVKKDNLVRPMVTGWKELPAGETAASAQGGGWLALIIALALAGAVVYAASGALLPPPPAAPPTPSW